MQELVDCTIVQQILGIVRPSKRNCLVPSCTEHRLKAILRSRYSTYIIFVASLSSIEIVGWFCFSKLTISDTFEGEKFLAIYAPFLSIKEVSLIPKSQKLVVDSTGHYQTSGNLN